MSKICHRKAIPRLRNGSYGAQCITSNVVVGLTSLNTRQFGLFRWLALTIVYHANDTVEITGNEHLAGLLGLLE